MAGGLRKYHTKSRNGCSQCKKRRKKCDQRPPRCSGCVKWGVVCDFTAWSAAVQPIVERAFVDTIPLGVLLAYPTPSSTFDTGDTELLYHYATQSSLTLTPKDRLLLFQHRVPSEAKSHMFLMHSVLAFSALHLSRVDRRNRDRHMRAASKQHQEALASFRESVKEVTAINSAAIAAFSFLTVVYTLGLPIVFGFGSTPSPASSFIDVLQVLRTAWSAIGSTLSDVENGSLRELIKPPPSKSMSCPMHTKGEKVIRFLERFLDGSPVCEEENRQIYREGLAHWENFFMNMPCRPPLWTNALVWPMSVSSEFFQLLLERRPFPMIMLAVWAVALERAPNMWFNAWGRKIIADIWRSSDDETREALRWPAEVVGVIPTRYHPEGCVCWGCREGDTEDPTIKVRDAAAAVLVSTSTN